MSVSTLRRIFLTAALVLSAQALLAANPSARSGTRMVFDESTGFTILFGGVAPTDAGTVHAYEPIDTWFWNGQRWLQRYPSHNPPGRSSHVMVYDATRSRVVLFGGRTGTTDLNDTWAFQNNDWSQIPTADAPSPRSLSGAAYDRHRDRIVLFGGNHTVIAANNTTQTVTNYYDTWEFDGTNWTKTIDNGPTVVRPLLVYDEARDQTLMIGEDDKFVPNMYAYDPNARVWNQLQPAAMPPCVNESAVAYQRSSATVLLAGGVCVTSTLTSSTIDEAWQWDGATWTKIATKSAVIRVTNQALSYDPTRDVTIEFGGTEAFGSPRSATYTFDPSVIDTANDPPKFTADWVSHDTNDSVPGPRSLAPLRADPVNKILYLLNGLTDGSFFTDFWMYQNGGWQKIVADNTPVCGSPFASFDTDRSRLVAVCSDGSTSEWDGAAWKTFPDLKTKPGFRRFAAMVYDPSLKKTVLYGGWDETNYVNTTWLWDGTSWTEQKNNRAPARSLAAMWFDPILKKTVIYGGIGRPNPQDRLQRYNDMWSLGADGWTEIKPAALPPTRYGAQVAVDPRNGHALLFGGLRLEIDSKGLQKQVYANDTWDWDGANWKEIQTANAPTPRENGSLEFDYGRNEFVLFGGWAGYYLSDTWILPGGTVASSDSNPTWTLIPEQIGRRRSAGGRH